MPFQPQNVLVTGGAGFIGANFIRKWLAQKHDIPRIVNLDLLTYAGSLKNLENLPVQDAHIFIEGDIKDKQLVSNILRQYHIDTLVHFAAESHVDHSIQEPSTFVQTNIWGTFILLEAAREFWLDTKKWNENYCRFHHISTDEVYGSLGKADPAFTEKTPYAPRSPYSASKASSDHLVWSYYHTYGLPVTMSYCSNNYGPYQHPEKFIPTVIRSCLYQQPIPVYGDGSNIRDWVYVEDHCEGIFSALLRGKNGKKYHFGGNCEKSNLMVVKEICAFMNEMQPRRGSYEDLIQFVEDRPGHDWRYAIDFTCTKNELAWEPTENFVNGLRKTINFFINHFELATELECNDR